MASKKDSSNVSVAVRIRPRNDKEINANMPVYFTPSPDGSAVQELDENGTVLKNWPYDNVFGTNCNNKDIFESTVRRLVDNAMEGYNTVVFMYGQTSSGKTFTLFGEGSTIGIVQHAMEHVHHRVMTSFDTEYLIKLTYAELYNEEIKDLLSASPNENLKIIDDPQLGPLIHGITEAHFTSASAIKQLLDEGENRRHFGVTNMNAHSSRSHVLVRLHIESRRVSHRPSQALRLTWGKDRPNCVSTLNLVDLAGSERASKSGTSGQSLKEGSYINRSLLTLGTVISNLSEGKLQHIPYRNSKLTRLLATALGGNAKTCVVACISPASGNLAESLNTLRFAARAKRIVNHVQKNEIMDAKSLANKLSLQAAEIDQLKQLLEMSRQLGFSPDDEEQGETLREQAVLASKSWRNLQFVVKNGPVILNSLRGEGLSQLAKKVGEDIRDAIAGVKDINDVVEDFSNVVETYLPKHRRLLHKIHKLHLQNESDALVSKTDMAIGHTSDSEGSDAENIVDMLQFGGDEMREQLEAAYVGTEELLGHAVVRVEGLQQELADYLNREKLLRKAIEESNQKQSELAEMIRSQKLVEGTLHKQMEEVKLQWRADVATHTEHTLQLTTQIGRLELQLGDQAELLVNRNHDLISKESDVDKLRNQIEQLTRDLNAALASKKSFEEEAAKARNDLRIQMDRLRNNMHEMLMQEGEEAKVLQIQNLELTKEMDTVKDSLDDAINMKERLETELSRIRADLMMAANESKQREDEISVLKDENANISLKLRELRLEITKLTSALSFSDASNQQLQTQLLVEVKVREEVVESKEKEMEALKDRMNKKNNEIQVELDIKDAELASAIAQIAAKQAHGVRIEQSLNADIARLEKKLASQMKRNEEVTKENTSMNISMHSMQHKHQDEVKGLKAKIAELQGTLDTINNYVDKQERELLNNNEPDAGTYNDDFDLFYYDSPMSRTNSMRIRRTSDTDGDLFSPSSNQSFFLRKDSEYGMSSARLMTSSSYNIPSRERTTTAGTDMDFDYPYVEEITLPSDKKGRSKQKVRMQSSVHYADSESEADNSLDDMLEQHSAQLSEYTAKLLYGMQMATLMMEHSMKEDKLIRSISSKQRQCALDQRWQDQAAIQKLLDTEEHLTECRSQMQQSLQFAEQRISTLEARCNQLEQDQQHLNKDYFRVSKGEKVSTAQASRYEQLYLDAKAQLDKIKLDLLRQQQDSSQMRLQNRQLSGMLDEAGEKQHVLEERLDLVRQQMNIVQADKDSLMERLLKQSTTSRAR